MAVFRKTGRFLGALFLGFLGILLLYAGAAVGLGYLATGESTSPTADAIPIFVRTNGVHTDFVVPIRSSEIDWSTRFPYQDFKRVDSTFRYVAFGWGDKGFYLDTPNWSDLKARTAWNALFFLSSTAMHVTYYRREPVVDADCRRLYLTQAQYGLLVRYIQESFESTTDGKPALIADRGYGQADNFYEAEGTYSFLRTCNVWTGSGLKAMRIRTAYWSPFDRAILYHLPTQ